jgi:hypothetical protein
MSAHVNDIRLQATATLHMTPKKIDVTILNTRVNLLHKMGGRRNTYGGVVTTPTRTVVRTPTRTMVRTSTANYV